jgi:hypothetical protein
MKTLKRLSVLFIIGCILSLSVYAQDNTECIKIFNPKYSIKDRWNIKASYSLYNTIHNSIGFFHSEKSNIRLELNYGFNTCLEAGIYGGIQLFPSFKQQSDEYFKSVTGIAPAFGVQINFHLLPLFVQNPDSHWELYLTAKYGGMIFTYPESTILTSDGTYNIPKQSDYEHEYCMGVGGGVYFWKVFGLYAEFSLGQFYSRPTYDNKVKIPCKLRGGFTFKF